LVNTEKPVEKPRAIEYAKNGTYEHDTKIDDVPEHGEVLQPEIMQLE